MASLLSKTLLNKTCTATRRLLVKKTSIKLLCTTSNTSNTSLCNRRSFHSACSISLDNAGPNNRIRYNYSSDCEKLVNEQINHELSASYFYTALGTYFSQPTVALPGVASYFINQSNEERRHAHSLINYQNGRGGKVIFTPIDAPPDFAKQLVSEKTTAAEDSHMTTRGFELAMDTERMIFDKIKL